MMKVTAQVQRSGDWWAISVPEIPGVFTQARRLSQVPDMVRDAVRLMEGDEALDVEVEIVAHTEIDELLGETLAARSAADEAAARASELTVKAAKALTASGITVRDAGHLLGVSPQRVAQLTAR
ncbi:type II toxin-antitoxin system HicB family antitoxin [uncultured Tessaracoccus sp.]|uniref:type II toxin-antitoxin system HicB family antitoxin n=1 Tax=uncultured Tessaracoccus sp. TaxID=905023 RepID=UPI002636D09A|nr:hypothetical protein [uncultured Tessaracoccus sp.]